jgi:hypothetical protein
MAPCCNSPQGCVPGCFSCAIGENHTPLYTAPTPTREFIDTMHACQRILTLGCESVDRKIKAITAEAPDLESEVDGLEELQAMSRAYREEMGHLDERILFAKRSVWYEDHAAAKAAAEGEEKKERARMEREEEMAQTARWAAEQAGRWQAQMERIRGGWEAKEHQD